MNPVWVTDNKNGAKKYSELPLFIREGKSINVVAIN